ncbi:acetyl-CoA hydrolase/transferase family protein [Halothermothrix orenii]|uniref:Acetyl-CoA hydrolase/transferase n=1 Tax=Halothermothrix orenii (strain H 168 / OCM 544 / DSM 9562) TaxID=373903 RepID=B8CZD4_HALOH|nr:acetyl-CoA hydrolase/transferase C-terminal domain-containing protein [Halothermothrix orenii]ACL70653.1 acetyl-CoA hydrolase/transferase [Halothermothrix orenii H 168]
MDFQKLYREKLVTARDAAGRVKSGDRIVVALGCGETPAILENLADRASELEGVMVDQMLPLYNYSYFKKGMEDSIRHNAWFISSLSRGIVNEGRADFTPNFFHEAPGLYREFIDVDILLATVSPMDKHGYFSFGVSVDYTKEVAEQARMVIVEVNENMPRTLGNSFIHISEIDFLVEHNRPLPELPVNTPSEVELKIGEYVASLIEDGSTLQLGIGGIPNAVTAALTDKKDLGIHSEMLTDGMVELVEKGVVTNRKKTLHPGKIIGSFAAGTNRLYEFLDDNPMVEMHPVSYTNDPWVISQNHKMVSVNSAIEVDLLGQCAAETVGTRQISGTGGQLDFVRGAVKSNGGKSIIALPSTAGNGKYSTIVPTLREGAVVTTGKNDVDYVVTEYGIAHLRGKTARERAEALIRIAHPDFRDELRNKAPYLY